MIYNYGNNKRCQQIFQSNSGKYVLQELKPSPIAIIPSLPSLTNLLLPYLLQLMKKEFIHLKPTTTTRFHFQTRSCFHINVSVTVAFKFDPANLTSNSFWHDMYDHAPHVHNPTFYRYKTSPVRYGHIMNKTTKCICRKIPNINLHIVPITQVPIGKQVIACN